MGGKTFHFYEHGSIFRIQKYIEIFEQIFCFLREVEDFGVVKNWRVRIELSRHIQTNNRSNFSARKNKKQSLSLSFFFFLSLFLFSFFRFWCFLSLRQSQRNNTFFLRLCDVYGFLPVKRSKGDCQICTSRFITSISAAPRRREKPEEVGTPGGRKASQRRRLEEF